MKLLGHEISFSKTVEKFKGYFDIGQAKPQQRRFYPGQYSWRNRCIHFNQLVEKHRLAQQAMLTVGGQLIAEGLYLQPATRTIDGKAQPYPRAEEAVVICEEFNKQINMETLLYDTGVTTAKYGSCFWEKTWSPRFDVRMIPQQENIEPEEQNAESNILRWRYGLHAYQRVSWSIDDIVQFDWNVTSFSWPYGTSLLTGTEVQFDTLDDLKNNANDFMEKQAWPYEMWQVGDGTYQPNDSEVAGLKSKWKNRQIGENMITSYPIDLKQGGAGSNPIRELSQLLDFMKDDIIDGVMVPPVSKLYNSTEASAKVLASWTASNLIKPMQRIIASKLADEVYKPLLMDLGYSVKTCPVVLFESPDAHKAEDAEFWIGLVNARVATPKQAAEELGIEFDETYWKQQEEREQEQFQQKQQDEEKEPVWEVRRKEVKNK